MRHLVVWWDALKGSESRLALATVCPLPTLQCLLSTYSVPGTEDAVVSKTGPLSFYGICNMMGRQTINDHQTDKAVTAHCVSATVESIRVLEQRPWEEGGE